MANAIALAIASFVTGVAVGGFSLGLMLHTYETRYERRNHQERA